MDGELHDVEDLFKLVREGATARVERIRLLFLLTN